MKEPTELERIADLYDDLERMVRKTDTWRGYVGYEEDGAPSDEEVTRWLRMGFAAIKRESDAG